jgi:tetratricopeptide (TPR) repeat protein
MPWIVVEYLLKGLFLGLLGYAALAAPSPLAATVIGLLMLAGLGGGLASGAIQARKQGARPSGRWSAYVLFLLLEYPRPIYLGTISGLAIGTALTVWTTSDFRLLFTSFGVGIAIGVAFMAFKMVRNRSMRLASAITISVAAVAALLLGLETWPNVAPETTRHAIGLYLLLGLPFFYLLTFVGEAEESEFDAAAWCAAMAIGIWLVRGSSTVPMLGLLIPLALFYVYVERVLPGLRVFKHTLRGISYGRVGLHRAALRALGKAIKIDPSNSLARTALWDVHRRLDPAPIDDELLRLIDPHVCLELATRLLTEPPTKAQGEEATRLLDIAERREPRLRPRIMYWRAVAATHASDYDAAAQHLNGLLDLPDDAERRAMLLIAWQLALLLHPGLEVRVGRLQLEKSGRRLEAIAAVERTLHDTPDNPTAWSLKRVLYAPLTDTEFQAGPVAEFDFAYAEQLGLALIDEPARFRRGAEFLAIAATGMPTEAPRLWHIGAETFAKHADPAAAAHAREQGKRAGLAVGTKQLPENSRHAYFAMLKALTDDAERAGDLNAAAANLSLFADYERSGLETLRALADLHERRGDSLAALNAVERGRLYDPKDADLLERRDKYLYSIDPATLRQATEAMRNTVDVAYCLDKARKLVDLRDADAELLDWAKHLTELALVIQPLGITSRMLAARARLRLGERDSALQLLEDVREQKPEKFTSSAEEESWRMANRMLADLYLDELDRPDLAVGCLQDFRKSSQSGADTLYKLGVAYERLNQRANAAKYYEQAASYEGHPLAADARDGLRRVKS